MQRAILMLQFFFFIFLENVIQPSTFLHEDKKTNLYQQPKFEMFFFFLSRFTQKQKLPLFSPTFQYFGSNFWSFYCHVILHMCIIFSYFLDFFPALKSHLLLFPFQIPFVHNFLENWYFPYIFGTRLFFTHIFHRCKYQAIRMKNFWEKAN